MTKAKAKAVAANLAVKCDEPYMFAVRVGTGCHVTCKSGRRGLDLVTLFASMLEAVLQNLKGDDETIDAFKQLLSEMIVSIMEEEKWVFRKF